MEKLRKMMCGLAMMTLTLGVDAQIKLPSGWQSSHVQISDAGVLTYVPDKEGNTIPDFSRVGYHQGDKSIPVYPVTKTVYPVQGDCHTVIQQAIDEVSALKPDKDGHRGVVLLTRGVYRVSETIFISASGVVLMGEGAGVNETRLIATGKKRYSLIRISGSGTCEEVVDSRVKIVDDFVPVGTHSFRLSSAKGLKVGDRVIVYRPGTREWIHDLKMDQIIERNGTRQWTPEDYKLAFERKITKIDGNRVYIDNPVVMQMDKKYGGGELFKYMFKGRIAEVGVSDICLESEFENYEDTEHGWIGIQFDKIEHGWVRNVTVRYFGYAAVSCERFAKNITVDGSRCLEAKSVITGGLRYAFNNIGQQNLFMNCQSTEGRHDYVTGAQVCGPNVFYNCTSSQAYADIGPHHRWAVGTLYDNIVTDGEINVQDRGNMGSGHGWAGVTQVLWNCRVRSAAVQSPWVSGTNYSIGVKGEKSAGHFKDRKDGVWEGQNERNVFPRSLYVAQLMARLHQDLRILIK